MEREKAGKGKGKMMVVCDGTALSVYGLCYLNSIYFSTLCLMSLCSSNPCDVT